MIEWSSLTTVDNQIIFSFAAEHSAIFRGSSGSKRAATKASAPRTSEAFQSVLVEAEPTAGRRRVIN